MRSLILLLCLVAAPAAIHAQQLGDVDNNGVVNVLDLVRFNHRISGQNPPSAKLKLRVDLTNDGAFNNYATEKMVKMILGCRLAFSTLPHDSPMSSSNNV